MQALRKVLRSKIHRATVTHADVNYEGSITIPPDLLEAAGIEEYEAVHVWNVSAGTRFETYAMRGCSSTRSIAINGAAARLVTPGDVVIVACFQHIPEESMATYKPKLVFVDRDNCIQESRGEIPGPRAPGLVRRACSA